MTNLGSILAKYPAVPRYTSYPTAPHFYALEPGTRAQWLAALPASEAVSLYLHIPYCQKLCWFCGCHTRITKRYEPVQHYLQSLQDESRMVVHAIGRRQKVRHIHFGGGSPSMLAPEDFVTLMSHLSTDFEIAPDAEVAMELDPRGVSEAKMAAYALAGVNRISLGVQDFCKDVQNAINRQQPFHTVYRTIEMARAYGIDDISIDLVYGLPKQTIAGMRDTLEKVLYCKPQRIALFGYAHVPWMKKAMRLIDEATLPDAAARQQMFAQAAEMLLSAGYVQIGLDHFALPEDTMAQALKAQGLRRNFQGYTTDTADTLIGLGASSISLLPQGYVQNPAKIEAYMEAIAQGALPQQKGFALAPDDRIRKSIIDELMCRMEVDLTTHCEAHGLPPDYFDDCLKKLAVLHDDGLVKHTGMQLRIPPDVPQAVRLACATFDRYYQPVTQRHAQVA